MKHVETLVIEAMMIWAILWLYLTSMIILTTYG